LLPGIDRAANWFDRSSLYDRASNANRTFLSLKPKKRGPFQLVPVIAKATLIGGANAADNLLFGDADQMVGNSVGGNDTLIGGANASLNTLVGDAGAMNDNSHGGNDTLIGGNNTNGSGDVSNVMYGDAQTMSGSAKGGNDILTAGTASAGGTVHNDMWGDGGDLLIGSAQGGADQVVFKDNGPMTVGTNNLIEDFSQSQHDTIEFSQVAGVTGFTDLTFNIDISGNTIIHAGTDSVTLIGFTGTLTAHDFLFA